MSLNLKNEETTALVTEVAERLGTTGTAAVRDRARARITELDADADAEVERRYRELRDFMEKNVWPKVKLLRHGSGTTSINDTTEHSEGTRQSADCHQADGRIHLVRHVGRFGVVRVVGLGLPESGGGVVLVGVFGLGGVGAAGG